MSKSEKIVKQLREMIASGEITTKQKYTYDNCVSRTKIDTLIRDGKYTSVTIFKNLTLLVKTNRYGREAGTLPSRW